ncbi:hypothetical protein [Saccharothrix sp. Mg75]|uniref:hypothetical protein n=1 Tax=Saccharothrix sp. Mg75 TaxID=3445357 RepID=UPI003EEF9D94
MARGPTGVIGRLSAVVLVLGATAVWPVRESWPAVGSSAPVDVAHGSLRARTAVAHDVRYEQGSEVVLRMGSLELLDAELVPRPGVVIRVGNSRFSGTVVLEARSVSGRLFGRVPITLAANALPLSLPAPSVTLTDVVAEDVRLDASTATVSRFALERQR